MKSVARIVQLDDLKGDRCVACAAPSETTVDLETPVGVPPPRERHATTARVCRRCAEAQATAVRPRRRLDMLLAAMPPLVGTAVGLAAGRVDGIATTVGLALALGAVYVVRAAVNRERARRTPVLLLEADGERAVLQLAILTDQSASPGDYRSAADAAPADDEPVKPLPPRTKLGIAWPTGLLVTGIVLVLGWSGTFDRSSVVLVDSPRRPVRIAIDDDVFELPAGGRASRKVRAGRHAFGIAFLDSHEAASGQFEARATRGVLLSTDADQCYAVWMAKMSNRPERHGDGPVHWIEVDIPERAFDRVSCERTEPATATPMQPLDEWDLTVAGDGGG